MSGQSSSKDIDRKIGVVIEHMNDQFERVLEAVQSMTETIKPLPKMGERIEKIEREVKLIGLTAYSSVHNIEVIKVRSEKIIEELNEIKDSLVNHKQRIKQLETA